MVKKLNFLLGLLKQTSAPAGDPVIVTERLSSITPLKVSVNEPPQYTAYRVGGNVEQLEVATGKKTVLNDFHRSPEQYASQQNQRRLAGGRLSDRAQTQPDLYPVDECVRQFIPRKQIGQTFGQIDTRHGRKYHNQCRPKYRKTPVYPFQTHSLVIGTPGRCTDFVFWWMVERFFSLWPTKPGSGSVNYSTTAW